MKKIVAVLVLVLISGIGTTVIAATDAELLTGKSAVPFQESIPPFNDPAVIAAETGRDSIPLAQGIQPLALPDQSDLVFIALQPCRILDTRLGGGGHIPGGQTRNFFAWGVGEIAGQGGNPAGCGVSPFAWGIAVTLTATNEDGPGNLRTWPCTAPMPTASSLNYMPAVNIANTTTLPICVSAPGNNCTCDWSVYTNVSGTDLVADVVGYFIKKVPTILLGPEDSGFTTSPACKTAPYTANGNQRAAVDGDISIYTNATTQNGVYLQYSTDGGATWNNLNGNFSWFTSPAGGWASASARSALNLISGTSYIFAVGFSTTPNDSRCHIKVMIVDR